MLRRNRHYNEVIKRPLRILVVADEKSRNLYDFYTPSKLENVDLILAAGDLSGKYLEFLSSAANAPLVYVRGNHDDALEDNPPLGCDCAEGRIVEYQGIRILGLGGSYKYRNGSNMYTEKEMRSRVRKLYFQLRRKGGFDILLTHAPIHGVNDLDTLTHRGFECFAELLRRWKPHYMIHGHIHMNYGMHIPRCMKYEDTTVINACEYYFLEYNES